MNKLIKVLFFLLLLCFSFSSEAKYRQKCEVRYMTESGWSKRYTVTVTFMTGYELNTATNSYKYSSNAVYAIIFWAQGQATIIKLSNYLLCGTEVDEDCIRNTISDLKGKDQDGDEWKVCVSDYCF